MSFISWWQKRSAEHRAKVYSGLHNEFLEKFKELRRLFYELKEMLEKRQNIDDVFQKLEELYNVHAIVWERAENLLSMDKRWHSIHWGLGWFNRGIIYMFKYRNNFNYDLASKNTLPIMENKLKEIQAQLESLEAKAT